MHITNVDAVVLDKVMHHAILVRVETNRGIMGYGEVMGGPLHRARWLKQRIAALTSVIQGQDPTDVERNMVRLRHHGGYKPLGRIVSGIENALWDIAGKVAEQPVYKLLGGKVRDRIPIYCDTGNGIPTRPGESEYAPEAYAERARQMLKRPEKFTMFKVDIGFHGHHLYEVPGGVRPQYGPFPEQYNEPGFVTEKGLHAEIEVVRAVKKVFGDTYAFGLDCGPGQDLSAAIRLAQALEPFHVMWAEDLLQGTSTPGIGEYTDAEDYRILTDQTSTPTLTGEHVYLRYGFLNLISKRAIRVIAPDIMDVGGLAETKWIAEYADLYGILIAPHCNGMGISFMCNVHAAAAMPKNLVAFEWHRADDPLWADYIRVDTPLIHEGEAIPPETPGLSFEVNETFIRQHLAPDESYFQT